MAKTQAEPASEHAELDALMGVEPSESGGLELLDNPDGVDELDAMLAAELSDGDDSLVGDDPDEERTDEQLLDEMTDEDVVYTVACDALEAGEKYTHRRLVKSLLCVEVDDARLALCLMVLRDTKPFSGARVLQLLEADPKLRDVAAEARSTVAMEEQAQMGEAEVSGDESFDEDPAAAVAEQLAALEGSAVEGAEPSPPASPTTPVAAEGSET